MARLLLALILAAVLHLLLFKMMIPVRENQPARVAVRSQVQVSLVRPVPPAPAALPKQPETVREKPQLEVQKPSVPDSQPREKKVPPPKAAVRARREPASRAEEVKPVQPRLPAAGVVSAENQVAPSAGGGKAATMTPVRQATPLADNRPPEYPVLARKRGWVGEVMLAVEVGADGTVRDIRVQHGSGHDLLDASALKAVRQWHFKPGRRNGEPVAMQVLVPVHFVLKEIP